MWWTSSIFTSIAGAAVNLASPPLTSPTALFAPESRCCSCSPGKRTRPPRPQTKIRPSKAEELAPATSQLADVKPSPSLPSLPSLPSAPRSPSAILIAGTTAVGKSAVALAVAERLGGEIISVDSMQVYPGLDIGTANTSPDGRRRVRPHLVDVVELGEPFDAARFARLAHDAVADG